MFRVTILCLLVLSATPAVAQETVFLIRHAEKERTGDDPALTEAGRARAAAWAGMLRGAGLAAVITSDAKRTRQTGRLIAEALDLPIDAMDRNDVAGLADALAFNHENERVLVVGHAETIPPILEWLGAFDEVSVSQDDFANLFILTGASSDEPVLIRMRMP